MSEKKPKYLKCEHRGNKIEDSNFDCTPGREFFNWDSSIYVCNASNPEDCECNCPGSLYKRDQKNLCVAYDDDTLNDMSKFSKRIIAGSLIPDAVIATGVGIGSPTLIIGSAPLSFLLKGLGIWKLYSAYRNKKIFKTFKKYKSNTDHYRSY